MPDKKKGGLSFEAEDDQVIGEYWSEGNSVDEISDEEHRAALNREMVRDLPDEAAQENNREVVEQAEPGRSLNEKPIDEPERRLSQELEQKLESRGASEDAHSAEQAEQAEQAAADKKKIKFNAKPLRDHGHMRHGPFQGADVGEESGALLCNFVWSLSKGGGRRLGGLIAALPRYGASHLASWLKSELQEMLNRSNNEHADKDTDIATNDGNAGAFVAEEGSRVAQEDDFLKLNIDPDIVERFNAVLADRNIDSLQIANPDGSMKFIIKAQDENAIVQALDDIIGVPDHELDERRAVAQQAQTQERTFSKENEAPANQHFSQEASVGSGIVGELFESSPTLDNQIEDGKKDSVQSNRERRQEATREHAAEREQNQKQGREDADKDASRQRNRSSGHDR